METKKNSLKPQDLVKIIQAGKECRVAELTWQDLKITFTLPIEEQSIQQVGIPLKMGPLPQEILEDLKLSDPLAYEEALLDGNETKEDS